MIKIICHIYSRWWSFLLHPFSAPFFQLFCTSSQVMGKGPRIWRWSNVATATPKYHIDRCVPWQDRWAPPENEQLTPLKKAESPKWINFQTWIFGGELLVSGALTRLMVDLPKFLSKGDQLEKIDFNLSENVKIFAYPPWWFGVLVGLGFESEHPPPFIRIPASFSGNPGFRIHSAPRPQTTN